MNGLLLLDKPLCYTSHDLVDTVRRKTGLRRVGHAGALDPMATGLVVLMIGSATKLSETLIKDDKDYEGILTLGLKTDTQDLEGRITHISDKPYPSRRNIEDIFHGCVGPYNQRTPRYSSAKIKGSKCYNMARRNIPFIQPVKEVHIHKLKITAYDAPNIYFFARVSKGTYIRAIAEDIGDRLNTGAVLSCLRRLRSGPFKLKDCLNLRQMEHMDARQMTNALLNSRDILAST